MAYGIEAPTEEALAGFAMNDSTNQSDVTWFTDCAQAQSTNQFVLDGGAFQTISAGGGTTTNNTAIMLNALGYTACSGVVSCNSGTTNNATGYAGIYLPATLLPGLTAPPSGLVHKYEYEALVRTTITIHSNSVRGMYRLGFQNSAANTAPTRGVYYEFLCNGTVTDSTWKVVILSSSGSTRVDTGMTASASTTYRMYLSTQIDSSGTYTTNYKIKNLTTGVNLEGTASPSSNSHYPTFNDYMGVVSITTKTVTATTTSVPLYIDYIGARVRRPVSREILITP